VTVLYHKLISQQDVISHRFLLRDDVSGFFPLQRGVPALEKGINQGYEYLEGDRE